jgi:hypothetical protein
MLVERGNPALVVVLLLLGILENRAPAEGGIGTNSVPAELPTRRPKRPT